MAGLATIKWKRRNKMELSIDPECRKCEGRGIILCPECNGRCKINGEPCEFCWETPGECECDCVD
jgi:hypothetical protein